MQRIKVLVIEDEDVLRNILYEELSEIGDVTVAVNATNGLAVFEHSKNFDVVLTDRKTPGNILGEEVIRRVKKLSPKTFVIFMSGEEMAEVHRVGIAAGADHILYKPFDFKELRETVQKVADRVISA